MLTSKELSSVTKRFAQEDRRRSWWHLWSTLAILAGLLAITCLDVHFLMRATASILAGLVFVRMFVIYHDHQHGTILRDSRLADLIMLAYGLWVLTPSSIWKRSHNHHHKNNGRFLVANIGSYPLMTTAAYDQASRLERFRYAVARHPVTMLLGYFSLFIYGMCLRPFLVRPREHWDGGLALVLHAGLITLLAIAAPGVLVFACLIPMPLAAALAAYLFYAQHNFPSFEIKPAGEWDYAFAGLRSSSYLSMGPVMRWFTGNIGYHHVHHVNARIPFYRLPEAMAAIEELQSPVTTNLRPVEIYRCLRLKLWDPQKNRLVTFAGD
ncbi:MAG: fatty acid desaturase family protein [Deltaproteobacteria bacterium]